MPLVKRAYRFRFYPDVSQVENLAQTFGCARFVYNWGLRKRSDAWINEGRSMNYHQSAAALTELKKSGEFPWLKDVSSVVLQQALRHLDIGFSAFFQKKGGYPAYKRKGGHQSASYMPNSFTLRDGRLTLAKQDTPLNVRWSRELPTGIPSSVTVSKDPAGRYFVSMLYEVELETSPARNASIGIDVGLTHFATLSNGSKVPNLRHAKAKSDRLARYQRSYARKAETIKVQAGYAGKALPKGVRLPVSNNMKKCQAKIARLHAGVADARRDVLHKLSTRIVHENQVICVEDLNVIGMLANGRLARSISDVAWSEFRRMLTYKAKWHGRELIAIPRFTPSSKRCSACGYTLESLPLKARSWTCPECGVSHDRDTNAAINIERIGLALREKANTAGHAGIQACQEQSI